MASSRRIEELAWAPTRLGEISLRRRLDPTVGTEVYEVKLGDEFLMSSLFTRAEIELARLGLAGLAGERLHVAVGGLGLGYTARAVLADPRVASLLVVEAIEEVIDWHRRGLLPESDAVAGDPRTRFVTADFFTLATGGGLAPAVPGRRFDAVLVDIDHSPRHLLHPEHAGFYRPAGLRRLAAQLAPGGVFGLWSNDPPDPEFTAALNEVFPSVDARVVSFDNPLRGGRSANTVYLASTPPTTDVQRDGDQ